MKKNLIIFLLSIFSLLPVYSEYKTSSLDVGLEVILKPIPYSITLLYGNDTNNLLNFTNSDTLTINELDLLNGGETKNIRVVISNGNIDQDQTFKTSFTANPFKMRAGGIDYLAAEDIKVFSTSNNLEQYVFTKLIPLGNNKGQTLAEVFYKWGANPELPSGDYVSTNTLNVSVE